MFVVIKCVSCDLGLYYSPCALQFGVRLPRLKKKRKIIVKLQQVISPYVIQCQLVGVIKGLGVIIQFRLAKIVEFQDYLLIT